MEIRLLKQQFLLFKENSEKTVQVCTSNIEKIVLKQRILSVIFLVLLHTKQLW